MLSVDLPLVSVAVITYNSANTIVETLNSIYNQTYSTIELIISDDCSTDDTLDICEKWLLNHKSRFRESRILSSIKNTGVAANASRAECACRSEWVKMIAGDDVLLPNCLCEYSRFVQLHPESVCVFSRIIPFGRNSEQVKRVKKFFRYDFFLWDMETQLKYLMLENNCIPAASVFYNKNIIKQKGITFDVRIPMLEDYPRWINLLKAGVNLDFIDVETVMYRVSDTSLSTSENQPAILKKSVALLYKYYRFGYEYKHYDKKLAIEKYLRALTVIYNNNIFVYMIFKFYKIFIMQKLH